MSRRITRLSGGNSKLTRLAVEINQHATAAERYFQSAVAEAIMAGEGLIEAKSLVKHGEWIPWVEANLTITRQTAAIYMRLAKHCERIGSAPSISAALALLTERVEPVQPGEAAEEPPEPQREEYGDDKLGEFDFLCAKVEHALQVSIGRWQLLIDAARGAMANYPDATPDDIQMDAAVLLVASTGKAMVQAELALLVDGDDDKYEQLDRQYVAAVIAHETARELRREMFLLPELPADDADESN
jgi:hypothetical protein